MSPAKGASRRLDQRENNREGRARAIGAPLSFGSKACLLESKPVFLEASLSFGRQACPFESKPVLFKSKRAFRPALDRVPGRHDLK